MRFVNSYILRLNMFVHRSCVLKEHISNKSILEMEKQYVVATAMEDPINSLMGKKTKNRKDLCL